MSAYRSIGVTGRSVRYTYCTSISKQFAAAHSALTVCLSSTGLGVNVQSAVAKSESANICQCPSKCGSIKTLHHSISKWWAMSIAMRHCLARCVYHIQKAIYWMAISIDRGGGRHPPARTHRPLNTKSESFHLRQQMQNTGESTAVSSLLQTFIRRVNSLRAFRSTAVDLSGDASEPVNHPTGPFH